MFSHDALLAVHVAWQETCQASTPPTRLLTWLGAQWACVVCVVTAVARRNLLACGVIRYLAPSAVLAVGMRSGRGWRGAVKQLSNHNVDPVRRT